MQGHDGLAHEKENTMNTSTRKKIITVAGALAIAGALVAGVIANGSDTNESATIDQIAEFEAMLNDGVIDQGTLETFLNDVKEVTNENATNTSGSQVAKPSEPQLDAKVTVKDDAPSATSDKSAESAPVDRQTGGSAATDTARQPSAPASDQAGAATVIDETSAAQPAQEVASDGSAAQEPAAQSGTTSTIPQWLLDATKSTNSGVLDLYKSWQSNGGTFSGITSTTVPTQPTVPSYNEICRCLGTC